MKLNLSPSGRSAFLIVSLLPIAWLTAQDSLQIPTTNLYLPQVDEVTVDDTEAVLYHPDFQIGVMEMGEVPFKRDGYDLKDLSDQYAQKGVRLASMRHGTLSRFEAVFLRVAEPSPMYQIMFGDEHFSAILNVFPTDATSGLDTAGIQSVAAMLEYHPPTMDPLEEHARFRLDTVGFEYRLVHQMSTMFGFENEGTGAALLVMQIPPYQADSTTAEQMITKFGEGGMMLAVDRRGPASVGEFDGYLVTVSSPDEENAKINGIALFVTTVEGTQLVFQLMNKTAGEDRREELEAVMSRFSPR